LPHSDGNWWITPLTDFNLFLHLKRFLGGKKFDSDDELKERREMAHLSLAADFYEQGIQNLVSRYDRCLKVGGSYIEK
jgi:hypothetical protein